MIYETNTLLLPLLKTYLKMLKHRTSLILSIKLVFICNFNVFILMFVIYFLFELNSLDFTFIGFTFLLIIFISDQSYKPWMALNSLFLCWCAVKKYSLYSTPWSLRRQSGGLMRWWCPSVCLSVCRLMHVLLLSPVTGRIAAAQLEVYLPVTENIEKHNSTTPNGRLPERPKPT